MKVMRRLFAIFLSAAIMLPIGTTVAFAETDTAESKDREIAMSVKEELYSTAKKRRRKGMRQQHPRAFGSCG